MFLKLSSGIVSCLSSSKLSSCTRILLQFSINKLSLEMDLLHFFKAYLIRLSLAEIIVALEVALIGASPNDLNRRPFLFWQVLANQDLLRKHTKELANRLLDLAA